MRFPTRYSVRTDALPEDLVASICDIDLSILGRPRKEYLCYMKAIRMEFEDIPEKDYAKGRSRILSGFLTKASQDRLFTTPWFRQRDYNAQAVENLTMEMTALRCLIA